MSSVSAVEFVETSLWSQGNAWSNIAKSEFFFIPVSNAIKAIVSICFNQNGFYKYLDTVNSERENQSIILEVIPTMHKPLVQPQYYDMVVNSSVPQPHLSIVGEGEMRSIQSYNEKLTHIASLGENWNGYGALPFSCTHLKNVESVLSKLSFLPDVFPTARDSIQLEYEKPTGEYLEFEVFKDRIEVFLLDKNRCENEYSLQVSDYDKINEAVERFHE